jgi:hypothetical protein
VAATAGVSRCVPCSGELAAGASGWAVRVALRRSREQVRGGVGAGGG